MLVEIIRELTKAEESEDVTNEQVLAWAKRVEARKAQSMIMNSLNTTKEFDNIKTVRGGQTNWDKTADTFQNAFEAKLQLLWSQPTTQMIPSLW